MRKPSAPQARSGMESDRWVAWGLSLPCRGDKDYASYGHSRHCASARCCDPGWRRARAKPRSARQADRRAHARRPVSRLGPGRSVDPRGDRRRRQPRDPRRRDRRRLSRRGRDCTKRERPSGARAHHGGLRLGDRVHGCCLRDRAVGDRGDGRCFRPRHSRVRRAFRESVRSALAVAADADCRSAARHNALA